MANEEYVRKLHEGVGAWNQWIEEHSDIWPDLAKANLRGADLKKANLRGADLSGADLSGADLNRAHLSNAFLFQTDLSNTCFNDADLSGANLSYANLRGANLFHADLSGAHLDDADLSNARLPYTNLRQSVLLRAKLQETNLESAYLENAYLCEADLTKADLSNTRMEGAFIGLTHYEGGTRLGIDDECDLGAASLEEANLSNAHLEKANLCQVGLGRANLSHVHLEGTNLSDAQLIGVILCNAFFDGTTILNNVTLGDEDHGTPSVADIHWGEVNLAVVNWEPVKKLGDEYKARSSNDRSDYQDAVRANRQLAVVLREQGLNEQADHFAYRAQVLQRVVWRKRRRPLKYIFSLFLDLLAGYGYRPGRSVIAYLLVIVCFAFGYYQLTHFLHAQPYPLAWYEALVLSVSSFHGRGFFQPVQSLGDPVAILASIEAVLGLLIEISFIATFTQRFFGR